MNQGNKTLIDTPNTEKQEHSNHYELRSNNNQKPMHPNHTRRWNDDEKFKKGD